MLGLRATAFSLLGTRPPVLQWLLRVTPQQRGEALRPRVPVRPFPLLVVLVGMSLTAGDRSIFHGLVGRFRIFFGEMSIRSLCPVLIGCWLSCY